MFSLYGTIFWCGFVIGIIIGIVISVWYDNM